MGGCLSKKKKQQQEEEDDINKEEGRGKDCAGSTMSRDPPPTEEEEVKEVLSETPNSVTSGLNLNANRQNSRRRPLIPTIGDQPNLLPLSSSSNNKIKDHISEIDRSSSNKKKKKRADLDDDVCREVVTSSEGFSASSTANLTDSSTTLTVNNVEFEGEDEEEGEGESTKLTRMKEMRSGVTRSGSTSPAKLRKKKINDRPDINSHRKVAAAGGNAGNMRVGPVDIGCRSGRSSPSKARENGSSRGRSTTVSSSFSGNYYKRSDVVVGAGERSGRRWASPADDVDGAAAANANANAMKRDQRTTNGGRSSPQAQAQAQAPRVMRRIPAASVSCSSSGGGGKVGQDGKYCVDHADATAAVDAAGGDGNLRSSAKETSLDNPLVSMECFIFL